VDKNEAPSVPATAEKAQQDPHCPWFLTFWTAPLVTQLTSPTISVDSSAATNPLLTVPR